MARSSRILGFFVVATLLLFYSPSRAGIYLSDFTTGLNAAFWEIDSNQPLYVVDDTQGDVRISKPAANNVTFQAANIRFRPTVLGDFDVSVDFRDASITRGLGQPGNQVQLNVIFGGQLFDVVRSDEIGIGQNRHVWISPPGALQGTVSETATSGTLRITRTGTTVTGYFNETPIFSGNYNNSSVTFMSFSLQNNGTKDATSVTFDNFRMSADGMVVPDPSAVGGGGRVPGLASLGISPNPFSSSARIDYHLDVTGSVNLTIFDVAGHRVATLVQGSRTPGDYSADWNAEDEHGARVPSGVYFARLVCNGGAVTQRLILLQ